MKTKVSIFSILFCLIASLSVSAANISQYTAIQDTIGLWPDGTPNGDADQQARIYVFLPEKTKATGRAVIACPGGSYYGCLPDLEGCNWAPFFNKQGIALIVLQYRLPRKKKEVPFSDAYEAIRVVKDSADKWNINKKDIGIMGSSAGGHLASTIATHAPAESRPAFQILFYPVISMETGITHADSRTNLLGTNPTQADIDLYSNEKQVTSTTPRAFIVFADDDSGVTPKNGALYYEALREKRIPASLFIYPKGGHGFGSTKEINFRDQLEDNLILWLNDFGEEYVHGTQLNRADWTVITSSEGPADDTPIVGGNNPYYMIDGDLNSAFLFVKPGKTYKGITVPSGTEPWFAIDLQQSCEMSYMYYRHRDYNDTNARLRASKGSLYGKNAETDEYQPIIENFAIATNVSEVQINFPSTVSYRFVKMVLKEWDTSAGNTIQVSEFNLGVVSTSSNAEGVSAAEGLTVSNRLTEKNN